MAYPPDPITSNCLKVDLPIPVDEDEMKAYLGPLITSVEEEITRRSKSYVPGCKFIINTPPQAKAAERKSGYCFLWVTKEEVLRMLIGLNYNGLKIYPKPEKKEEDEEKKTIFTISWSEEPDISYDEAYPIPEYRPDVVCKFRRAATQRVSDEYVEGKLFCKTPLPENYNIEKINIMFAPFVTEGKVSVTKTKGGNAFVVFSNKDDAYFALLMRMKYKDVDTGLLLSFDFCKKEQKRRTSYGESSSQQRKYYSYETSSPTVPQNRKYDPARNDSGKHYQKDTKDGFMYQKDKSNSSRRYK